MAHECIVCRGEPEPGYIEMPNNGPVVPCWSCNVDERRRTARSGARLPCLSCGETHQSTRDAYVCAAQPARIREEG